VQQRSAGQIRDNRRVSSSAGPGGRPDVRVFKLRANFQFGGPAVRPGLEGPSPFSRLLHRNLRRMGSQAATDLPRVHNSLKKFS